MSTKLKVSVLKNYIGNIREASKEELIISINNLNLFIKSLKSDETCTEEIDEVEKNISLLLTHDASRQDVINSIEKLIAMMNQAPEEDAIPESAEADQPLDITYVIELRNTLLRDYSTEATNKCLEDLERYLLVLKDDVFSLEAGETIGVVEKDIENFKCGCINRYELAASLDDLIMKMKVHESSVVKVVYTEISRAAADTAKAVSGEVSRVIGRIDPNYKEKINSLKDTAKHTAKQAKGYVRRGIKKFLEEDDE